MSRRTPIPLVKPEHTRAALVKNTLRSPGRNLDDGTRSRMEDRFGYDFSRVRIHNDEAGAASAQALHARAYTSGDHIVFGPGQYAPHAGAGEQLLTHELTHVVQQSSGPVEGRTEKDGLRVSNRADRSEQNARQTAMMQPPQGRMTPPLAATPQPNAAGATIQCLQEETASGITGAIFGGISALIAGAALAVAADPPTGAPPTGGVSITHLSQLTTNPGAEGGTVQERPLINIQTSEKSELTVSLFLRTNGKEIIEAYTEEKEVKGYAGGTSGDSVVLNFRGSAVGREEGAPGDKDVKEATIAFEGINVRGASRTLGIFTGSTVPQRFRGRFRVFGNGIIQAWVNKSTQSGGFVSARSDVAPPSGGNTIPYVWVKYYQDNIDQSGKGSLTPELPVTGGTGSGGKK